MRPLSELTPKGLKRYKAIVEAAREVFIEYGFSGASIEKVIALSGGSFATVYRLFGDKEGLFIAVVESMVNDIFSPEELEKQSYKPETLEATLEYYGILFLNKILDSRTIAVYKLAINDAYVLPKIGSNFFTKGPEHVYKLLSDRLTPFLDQRFEKYEIDRLACQYLSMLQSDLFTKALCYKDIVITQTEINSQVQYSISFMLSYLKARSQ